jgi:hypothetical protein
MIVPTGTLSYSLNYRGEALLAFSGETAFTAGVRPYVQGDFLRFGQPGYSFLAASDLASKVYADPGTVRGFVIQASAEISGTFGQHFFVDGRFANQWGFQGGQVRSSTTGEAADAEAHTNLSSIQVGCGYWF